MFLVPKSSEIRERRAQHGLSRFALSKKAGLGSYAVARLEEKAISCHPLRAQALANALECTVEDIFETKQ